MGPEVVPFQAAHWPSPHVDEDRAEALRRDRKGGAAQRYADLLQSVDRDPDAVEVIDAPAPARLRVVPNPDGIGPPRPVPVPVEPVEVVDAVGDEDGGVVVPDIPTGGVPTGAPSSRYQQTLRLEAVLEVLAGEDREWRRAEVAAALGRSSGDGSVGRRLEEGVRAGLVVVTGPKHGRLYRATAGAAGGAASQGG
jgi:hypothetical protein